MTDTPVRGECDTRLGEAPHRLRPGRDVTAARWLQAPASGERGHVVGSGSVVVHLVFRDPEGSGNAVPHVDAPCAGSAAALGAGDLRAGLTGPVRDGRVTLRRVVARR